MNSLTRFIITTISIMFGFCANAQDSTSNDSLRNPSHALETKVEKDRIILRWAPGNYSFFRQGVDEGYIIERRAFTINPYKEFSDETDVDGDFKVIKTVLPWTEDEWKANAKDTGDVYAGVAMQIQLSGEANPKTSDEVSQISTYYEDQQRRFAFALLAADFSETAALGLGLRYNDTDVKPGYYYEYRIRYANLPEGLKQDTVEAWADMTIPYEAHVVDHCFLESSDQAITVYWTRHNDQFFTAYDIERSTDKVNWKKLNRKPWITSLFEAETPNFFVDSIDNNSQIYYYRVRGYTLFADMGKYSEIMSDKGVDQTPPAPAWGVKAEDMGGYVALEWEAMPNEPDFDGFYVERSDAANGFFERISEKLPADARQFADLMPDQLSQNYYRVVTIDKLGNEAPSFSDLGYILDSMPPSIPVGLRGEIDTFGRVNLDWTPGPEADIIGYRVYWSNDKETEFTQLTGDVIPGINFTDSIKVKTLNEEIYYRIVAVDHRFNHSEYSQILTIKKPDLVPPSAALIYDYEVKNKSLTINWHPSSSDDVEAQEIFRKLGSNEWKSVNKTKNIQVDSLFDENLKEGQTYSYKIVTYDDANNSSESQTLNVTIPNDGLKETKMVATVVTNQKEATLTWQTIQGKVKYVVYKQSGENTEKLFSVYNPVVTWSDKNYKIGDTYQLRVIYSTGEESQMFTFSAK